MTSGSLSILVVDDDQDIAANLTDILRDLGHRADQAHCGSAALHLVQQHDYDLALLDFKMPDMDGVTLFSQIKSVQPDMATIMITAYAGSEGVQRAKEAGTWQVLRKPIDISELLAFVATTANGRPLPRPSS